MGPQLLIGGVCLVLGLVSLIGWGRLYGRVMGLSVETLPLQACVGLAVVIVVGGVLNLSILAYGPVLDLVAATGLVVAARDGWRARDALRGACIDLLTDARAWAVNTPILVIAVFAMATQGMPLVFNVHDDFEKYFVHVARMLETGTVFGSPLSAIGMQTLGGQAFLQGFVVSHFSERSANAVDAVLALTLCCALVGGLVWRRRSLWPVAGLGVICITVVPPQVVNVSAVYTIVALVLGVMALDLEEGESARTGTRRAATVGLFYAAGLALKTTFALFVVVHFLVAQAVELGRGRALRLQLRDAGVTAAAGLGLLLPWLGVHAGSYLSWWRAPATAEVIELRAFVISPPSPFSWAPMEYGGSLGQYALLGLGACAATAALTVVVWSDWTEAQRLVVRRLWATGAAGLAAFWLGVYTLGPQLASYDVSARYGTPVLLAVAPGLVCCTAALAPPHRQRVLGLGLLALTLGVVLFLPSAVGRAMQAAQYRTGLALPRLVRDATYVAYNEATLSTAKGEAVRRVQALVPEGEPIVAWMSSPFHLDFARNPIIDVDPAGVVNPWAAMPDETYVIWEYQGYAMPDDEAYRRRFQTEGYFEQRSAATCLLLLSLLGELRQRSAVLFDDGHLVVFRRGG